jgi:oligopeptidase B
MTRRVYFLTVLTFLWVGVAVGQTTADMEPPKAKIEPKADTMFDTVLVDNYFWLRDRDNPEVIAYLEAENDYTEASMSHAKDLQEKLYNEMVGRIKETDLSVPVKVGDYYYYSREEKGKQYEIYCRKAGSLEAEEEILLDLNKLAEGHDFLRLGAYEVSDDHRLLAYAIDTVGNERYTLHVKDLTTGQLYPETIDNLSGDVEWAADNRTIFYTVPDDAWRPYRLYRHVLDTDPTKDVLVYEESDDKFWMDVGKTKDKKYLLIGSGSKVTSEYRYLPTDDPTGEFTIIQPRVHEMEYEVYHHGGYFYIVTNADGAKNFKLVKTSVETPGKEFWEEVIPYDRKVKIDGLDVFKDYLVVYKRENGLQAIEVRNLTDGEKYDVDFPEPVYAVYGSSNPEYNSGTLRFTYMSLVTPNSVYDYNMETRERELKKRKEVLGDYDPDDYQSERIFATAEDGTKIPISLVYRKGMTRNGNNPLYLYGYGAYGISMDPWFSSNRLSLLDRGFIFAIAHIRGGGELGRYWYDEGKLRDKVNTFTDFIACAEHLIDQGYTSSKRLAISGGSAGGLLIGAVVNMRPDLCEVAVANVPFVDIMNTMLDESIPLTVVEYEEWGNPNEKKFFDYMLSYSPYDNVKKQAYPNMFITGGLHDTRVQYWEPAKWTAKLQANNTGHNRILLKTNMGAGHGGKSGRYDYLRDLALEYAFVLDCFGIKE